MKMNPSSHPYLLINLISPQLKSETTTLAKVYSRLHNAIGGNELDTRICIQAAIKASQ